MVIDRLARRVLALLRLARRVLALLFLGLLTLTSGLLSVVHAESPGPVLQKGEAPVDWWFVFKFTAQAFPGCGGST
jgi:hypothetical protein